MSIEVKVPVLPESVSDAVIATWHKKPGDTVRRDENLVDLETDKVVLEVPAPTDGVLKQIIKKFPQALVSLRVRDKREFADVAPIADCMRQAETALGERGRILVRYSGTEPVARVMVEGEDQSLVEQHAHQIAQAIRLHLG